jgi:hypothetical protein
MKALDQWKRLEVTRIGSLTVNFRSDKMRNPEQIQLSDIITNKSIHLIKQRFEYYDKYFESYFDFHASDFKFAFEDFRSGIIYQYICSAMAG